jgi:hypothetical protein
MDAVAGAPSVWIDGFNPTQNNEGGLGMLFLLLLYQH